MADVRRTEPALVSVVVPVHNDAGVLRSQLECLTAQDYEGAWEVVIADNGSTDLARRCRPRLKALTLVDSGPRRGHPAPRNAGAKAVLPGVRVPDPAGLLRPCRRGGADHRRAGGRVDVTGAVGTIVRDGVNGIVVDPPGR